MWIGHCREGRNRHGGKGPPKHGGPRGWGGKRPLTEEIGWLRAPNHIRRPDDSTAWRNAFVCGRCSVLSLC